MFLLRFFGLSPNLHFSVLPDSPGTCTTFVGLIVGIDIRCVGTVNLMALSDTACRNARRGDKPRKLSDAGGLFLLVAMSGGKLWRFSYRFARKQKTLAFGAYPAVSLIEARAKRDAAKVLLAKGIDPSIQKKLDHINAERFATNTFEAVANDLLAKLEKENQSPKTLHKKRWMLDFAVADIGKRPIAEITSVELLAVLRKIEKRGRHETAVRLRSLASSVFRYGIATGRAERDPASDLRGALITPKVKHYAAIIDAAGIGGLLRSIDGLENSFIVKCALLLASLTFVRPGELRFAEWVEFDLNGAIWRIPASKMKMKREHRVPLARQTLKLLDDLHSLSGSSKFLFPSARSWQRPISENTLNAALRRLGYNKDEMTAHGFRSMASSQLNEMGLWNPDAIERQLAHQEENEIRRAYMHGAEFWNERVKMMQAWADTLDILRDLRETSPISSIEA